MLAWGIWDIRVKRKSEVGVVDELRESLTRIGNVFCLWVLALAKKCMRTFQSRCFRGNRYNDPEALLGKSLA